MTFKEEGPQHRMQYEAITRYPRLVLLLRGPMAEARLLQVSPKDR